MKIDIISADDPPVDWWLGRKHVLNETDIEYVTHACNYIEGCDHGCLYPCYARIRKIRKYDNWINAKPVYGYLGLLKKDILHREEKGKKIGDVMLCSSTDGYCQTAVNTNGGMTRRVIEVLIDHDIRFTICTKSSRVLDDLDLLRDYDNCRVGLTIISHKESFRKKWEPGASPLTDRVYTLKHLHDCGVSTFVSMEPIFKDKDNCNPFYLINMLNKWVDLFIFGRHNYYKGAKADRPFYHTQANFIEDLCKAQGIKYLIKAEMRK
ncbi:hypothetical protein LCGC14_2293040 [marine sediment metagenome]|uniref:Radical SAM core domain-containing protein n=1 Tax=marine sediment metagenome TaxID=412755 RepID=A0A0F9CQM0_9ZZZZ